MSVDPAPCRPVVAFAVPTIASAFVRNAPRRPITAIGPGYDPAVSGNLPPIELLIDEIRARDGSELDGTSELGPTNSEETRLTSMIVFAAIGVGLFIALAIYADPFRLAAPRP
jgi:hypothetical protein